MAPDAEPDAYEGKRTAKALLAFAKELLCNPHTLEGCSDAAKSDTRRCPSAPPDAATCRTKRDKEMKASLKSTPFLETS